MLATEGYLMARVRAVPVLVVRMFLHVNCTQSLGLVDEGPFLGLREQLPLGTEPLRDLGIVHFRVFLSHFASLSSGPDHKGVHGPLHPLGVGVGGRALVVRGVVVARGVRRPIIVIVRVIVISAIIIVINRVRYMGLRRRVGMHAADAPQRGRRRV